MVARRLEQMAPTRIRLPNGRQTKVHYEPGQATVDCIPLAGLFRDAGNAADRAGATPVVVHLLAPNQRAVQTTSDLAGFWERLYPQVRRELMRRYPRHSWPERP